MENTKVKKYYYKIKNKEKISYTALSLTLKEMKELNPKAEIEEITREEWNRNSYNI